MISNAKEILGKLEEVGVIIVIGDKAVITEEYKHLLGLQSSLRSVVALDTPKVSEKILKGSVSNAWKEVFGDLRGKALASAFLNKAEVPNNKEGLTYRLRDSAPIILDTLDELSRTQELDPTVLINAFKLYYEQVEYPKTVKNVFDTGLYADLYNEFQAGTLRKTVQGGGNQGWG